MFKPIELALVVVFPAWKSYKCLEHAEKEGGGGGAETRQWLTYWLIFASVHCIDTLLGFVLEWGELGKWRHLFFGGRR